MKTVTKVDPRRALAIKYYNDPASDSFGVVSRSLAKAGFSKAMQEKRAPWLMDDSRIAQLSRMVRLAERNLNRIASIEVKLSRASNKAELEIAKLQTDISKFVLERLAKSTYNKGEEFKAPEITINIVEPKAPSATRDAEVIEPEQLEQGATRE